MNGATTCFMARTCLKISDTGFSGIPKPASSSRMSVAGLWSLLIAACTRSTFSGALLVEGLPERGSLSTDSRPSLKCLCHFYVLCTYCIFPESLPNHLNSFCGGMFKLNTTFDVDLLLYLMRNFECDSRTVHMLT